MTIPANSVNWLARRLGLRREEFGRTALMFLYLLFVLLAYYILKPVSRALFLTRFDASQLPFLYLAMAASGGVLAYHYARIAVRWSLAAAVNAATALIIVTLLAIWQLLRLDQAWLYYVFNIWVSLFSLVLVSQGWLVAGHVFDARAAKRVYSLLAAGAVLGAATGGSFTALVVRAIGTANLAPVAALFVLMAYGCFRLLLRQPGVSLGGASAAESGGADFTLADVARDVRRRRHLQVIIALLLATYIVDTLVEYQFSAMARASYQGDRLTAFLGGFYGLYLNLATFVLQVFLTSLVVTRFGVGGTLLVMPAGIGAAMAAMAVWPGIWAAGAARLIEASTRYSFNRTGMELLYMPLPADLRNRTKAFVDIFVDRVARGAGALLILGLAALGGTSVRAVSVLTLGACAAWAALAVYARRQYLDSVRQRLEARRLDLESMRVPYQDARLIRRLEELAQLGEGRQSLYALRMLSEVPGYPLEPLAARLTGAAGPEVRAWLFETALERGWRTLLGEARRELALPPGPALTAAAAYYGSLAEDGREALARLRDRDDPAAAEAALRAGPKLPREAREAIALPLERVRRLAADADPARRRLAALAYRDHPHEGAPALSVLAMDPAPDVRRAAAEALRALGPAAVPALAAVLDDRGAAAARRRRAARLLGSLPVQEAGEALLARLNGADPEVLDSVLRALERQRRRAPELRYPHEPVRRQVSRAARDYLETRVALACLAGARGGKATGLLVRTLEARLDRIIHGLFTVLGLRYPPRDMQAAWRAVRRGTPAERANAAEFLDNILDHELKRFVLPLLDEDRPPEQAGRELFGLKLDGPREALRAMLREGDPWLAACAMAAAAELGFRDLAGEVRAAARRAGAAAAQVAEAALRALEGAEQERA
jgi:ATP/ADP translocase